MTAQTNVRDGHGPSVAAESSPRSTWLAVVALYLLAPVVAELLTGSTPPLAWNNVGGVVLTVGLYGSGALLAREIVCARRLSWANLAILGIAYGVLEEGMAYQSWFNPRWTPPPDAARALDVNWTFVVGFTSIHVVLSIITSIVLAEALFPRLASRPWLGPASRIAFTVWLGLVVLVLALSYGFAIYHGRGYDHPPASYVIAPAVFVACLLMGTLLRIPPERSQGSRRPPGYWSLRIAGFLGGGVVLVNLLFLRVALPIHVLPIAFIVATDVLGVSLVRRWARCPGWGMSQRLALVSGVMGVFIVFSPVFEFVIPNRNMTGLTLVNLLALGGLIFLAHQVARYETTSADAGTA
jgi:hypothetical protein